MAGADQKLKVGEGHAHGSRPFIWLRLIHEHNSETLRMQPRTPKFSKIVALALCLAFVGFATERHSRQSGGLFEVARLSIGDVVNAVAWNKDASKLAVLSNSGGTVSIFETKDWRLIKTFHHPGGAFATNHMYFLPDGSLLVPAEEGGIDLGTSRSSYSLEQYDVGSGMKIQDIGQPDHNPRNVWDAFTVSRDGTVVSGFSDALPDRISTINTTSWKVLATLDLPRLVEEGNAVHAVTLSPEAKTLVVGAGSGVLAFFDLTSEKMTAWKKLFADDFDVVCLAFNMSGSKLAVGATRAFGDATLATQSIKILSTQNGQQEESLIGEAFVGINDLSWEGDDLLAVGSSDGLSLFDPGTHKVIKLYQSSGGGFYSVQFGQTGMLAASYGTDVFIYAKDAKI